MPDSVAGALQGPGRSSCSVWERCRSVEEVRKQELQRLGALQERCRRQKQQLQRLGALQERCTSVARALQWPGSRSCSAWERCRSVTATGAGDEAMKRPESSYGNINIDIFISYIHRHLYLYVYIYCLGTPATLLSKFCIIFAGRAGWGFGGS